MNPALWAAFLVCHFKTIPVVCAFHDMRRILISFLLSLSVAGAESAPVDKTRSTLEEWVLTEKTISEEREAWQAEKATMTDLIALLQDEKQLLAERRAEAEAVTTQAEQRRGELLEQKQNLQEATTALDDQFTRCEESLLALGPRLPAPLLVKVQPLLRRLPAPGQPTKLSAGQRAQNLVGILGEIDKFNREVTLDTQIQQLPDGRSAEVRVLYIGLGAAFFADVSGRYAGILEPGPEGWMPVSRPELAEAINETIAQYERSRSAGFVNLPLEIQ